MSKLTIVNPHDWLNPDGSLPENKRIRNQMIRVAQCIEYGGPLQPGQMRETLVPCRRRPGGDPCPGLMWVLKEEDDIISCFCMACRQGEFVICEWADTVWANGPMEPVPVDERAGKQTTAHSPSPNKPRDNDEDSPLGRALAGLGSALTAAQVRELVATAQHPGMVLQAVMGAMPIPPEKSAVEKFLPLLMDAWNRTPRPELGGRSPTEVHGRSPGEVHLQPMRATPKPGRNDPCPCGSGKKYKRCCLQ